MLAYSNRNTEHHPYAALVYGLYFTASAADPESSILDSASVCRPCSLLPHSSVAFLSHSLLLLHLFPPVLLKRQNVRSQVWWLVFVNPVVGDEEGSGKRKGRLWASQSSLLREPQVSLGNPVFKNKVDESGGMACRFVPGLCR